MIEAILVALVGPQFILANEPVYESIKTVHVVNSCHLDIGFADSSVGIINRYFDHHLPMAASVGAQLRRGVIGFSDSKLNFMFQSWVLDMFFDCPRGLGLHCPSKENITMVRTAIAHNDITWHAFPHNAQLEVMDPSLIKAGIELTHTLDSKFGQEKKSVLSQRDVPGMTRALIPLLRRKGIRAISIGANDGSTPPALPPCFLWKSQGSNFSIIGLFNWPGYGSLPLSQQRTCLVEGFSHALVYNWNGDNAGPSNAANYGKNWQDIAKSFPNANIYASTLDNFTQHLEQVQDKLPVIDKEVGDTWIYGVPSDPQKVSRMRVINRAYAAVDLEQGIETALAKDDVLRNATRFFLKLGEHTWGKDVKSNLNDNYDWKNADFAKARRSQKNGSQYEKLESSWWEQRHWGVTVGVDTLAAAHHSMTKSLNKGFAELRPMVPSTAGYKSAKPGDIFRCGSIEIGFDKSGSISHLKQDNTTWADGNHSLFQVKYRSYSAADVSAFFDQYCKSKAGWVEHDYGKPGLPSDVKGQIWSPALHHLYVKMSRRSCDFLLQTAFDPEASTEYGAAAGWTQVSVGNGGINVSIGMFNKTTTRIPEAMFVQFLPAQSNGAWSANKLGTWIAANDVIDGGAKHLHGIMEDGLRFNTARSRLSISALDAAVANFGELTAYPSPVHNDPNTATFGSSFVLWDNLWGTNYVMWWPFVVPPPAPYNSSSVYFPTSWNNDIISRFHISFDTFEAEPRAVWI